MGILILLKLHYDLLHSPQHSWGIRIIIYADESILTQGKMDFTKLNPILLGQVTTEYHALGDKIGNAWNMGLKKKE